MKLLSLFLLAASLQVSASGISQSVTLKATKKPLAKVLQELSKQTGYECFYRSAQLKQASPVTVEVNNVGLKKVLDLIFKDQPFSYAITNNTIVISPKPEPAKLNLPAATVENQVQAPAPVIVKGKVTDEKGLPLQGASVFIKGADKAAITDVRGEFRIEIPETAPKVLVISFVGMETKEIALNGKTEITVSLAPSFAAQQEVVVVGYGTQKKTNLTGAVATIKMDELAGDRPVSTTGSLLQGALPGLEIDIASGKPGASASFNIRGGTDFGSASNSGINTTGPFILVDNIPFNGALNMLNPNDIESISVLKDAGSAAIYGARSAFGVILINTKKGSKNQKTQFNYSNNFAFSKPMALPQRATPQQMVQSWIDSYPAGATYWGAQNFQTWMQLLQDYQTNPKNYSNGYAVVNNVYYQLAPIDQIHDLLGNSAFQQMHNLSVSGGSDKTTYRLSFGTTNEQGILAPAANADSYKRYTAKSVVTSDVTPWLNMQFDANYYYSLTTSPFNTNAFATATVTPNVLPDSLPSGLGLANSGPITTAKNTLMAQYPTTNRNDDIRMTARAIAKPVKGLTITGEYTYDNLRNQVNTYDKQISNLISTYTLVLGTTGTGMYTQSQASTDYQAFNLYATYNHKLGNDHNFSLMAGFNQEQSDNKTSRLSATGMYDADHPAIATATGTVTGSDTYDQYSNRGVFGRLNYDYKSKYLVEFDGRYDGSSKFPDGHRWGFFPSVSGAWRVTEEKFMQGLKPWLNEFKLRASVGSVGNQNIPDYSYYSSMYAYNPYWMMGGVPVLSLSSPSLISSAFTWETVRTLDLGVNWGMFNNRLTGVFDWYQRDTKDILTSAPVPLPATLGTGAPLQNSGALQTKGIELGLNWKETVGKVTYSIGVNLYNYQSVVTNAVNPNKVLSNLYIGQKMGDVWGYVTDRLYTTNDFTAPASGWTANNYTGGTLNSNVPRFSGQSPNPGDVLYKKFDTTNQYLSGGAGTLDNPGDKRIIGNSNPQYQYGITGSIAYKNFDFSFVINGVLKQDLWLNNGLIFPNSYQSYSQIYANELNYWTPTNLDAYYGRIYYQNGNQNNNQLTQTRYMMNGSFMRMRNMTLRYTVPANALKKYHINRLQVFYSIENAFEFNHLPKGVYPDVDNQGGGNGSGQGYPFMRKSSVGINLSF